MRNSQAGYAGVAPALDGQVALLDTNGIIVGGAAIIHAGMLNPTRLAVEPTAPTSAPSPAIRIPEAAERTDDYTFC
jgi:hypothetical protein